MTQEKQETREEEVARVRSYLASQAMHRGPEQIVEALREAYQQFLTATAAVPDAAFHTVPKEGEWSAADVLAHVRSITASQERSICGVLERGEQPTYVDDVLEPQREIMKAAMTSHGEQPTYVDDVLEQAATNATREQMLTDIEAHCERLIAVVLQADPETHLDIVWGHNEFGNMNWREWLLFARVHTLDHARQMQAIAAILVATPHP